MLKRLACNLWVLLYRYSSLDLRSKDWNMFLVDAAWLPRISSSYIEIYKYVYDNTWTTLNYCGFFLYDFNDMTCEKRRRDEEDVADPIPHCSICIQGYSNRAFLRPCYHSFCFQCIRHWINITSQCPICRQEISSLVYNIDEDEDNFDEYHLKDKGNKKEHDPPLWRSRRYMSPTERITLERSKLYKGKVAPSSYPPPLQKHHTFTIITPEHIPRASIFIKNELPIIYNGMDNYDAIVEEQILQTLLLPFKDKKTAMDDANIIGNLAGWLDDDENVAKRLIVELVAYLKSGLSYKHFVSTAMYKPI